MISYSDKLKDPRWQKMRLKVLERDGFSCVECGNVDKTLHVHHNYYEHEKEPWEYHLNSLVTLCEDCHDEAREITKELNLKLVRHFRELGFLNSNIDFILCRTEDYSFIKDRMLRVEDIILRLFNDKEFYPKCLDLLSEHTGITFREMVK